MSMPATLSRKIQKVLETKTESPDLGVALQRLSTFYGANTAVARTNLRGEIEKRGLEINNNFLASFKELQKQLDDLQKDVDEMQVHCTQMSASLTKTKSLSDRWIEHADKLWEERKKNEKCTFILDAFLTKFQLSEEEQRALQSPKVNEPFLDAIKRMDQIQADCKLLLRSHHYQAGIEIMDSITLQQESAYRKLYRWTRDEIRTMENDAMEPEYDRIIPMALKALHKRPVYLAYCLSDVGTYRCKALLKGFINALTIGGPNGMPRPIEVHAHDPIRYVGDMLAWIHQALASEHELMNNLIGTESAEVEYIAPVNTVPPSPLQTPAPLPSPSPATPHAMPPNFALSLSTPVPPPGNMPRSMSVDTLLTTGNATLSGVSNLVTVLNISFDGIRNPFKVRIDQVLLTKPEIAVVFRLANLLDFYARTIVNLMAPTSPLPLLFNECKHDCLEVFHGELKDQSEKLKQNPPAPQSDLSPPTVIREAIVQLKDLLSTFNSSLVPKSERVAEFSPILRAIVDPLLQVCTLSATVVSLDPSSTAVYMINCISSLMVFLVQYDFAISRVEMLNEQIEIYTETLIEEQATRLLRNCGLLQKLSVVQHRTEKQRPLAQELGMGKHSIFETIKAFENTIIEMGVLIVPHCDRLINARIRSVARKSIAKEITQTYTSLYNAILDPESGYDTPQTMFKHTPQQIETILNA
eukprot:Phypoly_transcript_02353.p1 GENE.Phypoly_transcript_02353~~Phypoly_transcript_02353.p1  ORF type:complete len:697 (-),score=97.91 Phypoly_transcript_02353:629-2719(-)